MNPVLRFLCLLIICVFSLFSYSKPAQAYTYSDFGITFEIPDFILMTNPDVGNTMTAVAKSGENIRLSVASINMGKDEYNDEELEQLRLNLHSMYVQKGNNVVSSDIFNYGRHKGIAIQFDSKVGNVTFSTVLVHLFIHNKRYIVTYGFNNYNTNNAFEIIRVINNIRCVNHL